jgi:CMP/dCMP kinase
MSGGTDRKLIIAIDGPAGAGKSTIAAHLARKLGYLNIETGAIYRALALKAMEKGISQDNGTALLALSQQSQIRLEPTAEGNRVFLDGRDVSQRIRERDVTDAASRVSVHPQVREWMVARQREMGRGGGVIMEGRDIGTKVFPDADVKVFLDADPSVRAERRINQHRDAGSPEPPHAVVAELHERDRRDIMRAASPLVPAADAVIIDSSTRSIEQVISTVEQLVEEQMVRQTRRG